MLYRASSGDRAERAVRIKAPAPRTTTTLSTFALHALEIFSTNLSPASTPTHEHLDLDSAEPTIMSKKAQYKQAASADKAPANWTATRPHKYCGKMDAASPRKKKANKTHLCEACAAIKAQCQRLDSKAMANRREEKMTWMAGDEG